jgi:hypothetical protein
MLCVQQAARISVCPPCDRKWPHQLTSTCCTSQTIDAWRTGNRLKFINHAPPSKASLVARTKVVDGDHRVGLYVAGGKAVAPGEELCFYYGESFHTLVHGQGGGGSGGGRKKKGKGGRAGRESSGGQQPQQQAQQQQPQQAQQQQVEHGA